MSTLPVIPQQSAMAIFAVCAAPELTGVAAQMSEVLPGVVFAGEFGQYITSGRQPQFSPAVQAAQVSVALIDFDGDPDGAIETAEILNRMASPVVICIGVSSRLETGLLLRSMRAGCSEFLEKPVAAAQLQEVLERLQRRVEKDMRPAAARGRVLSFFGAKGGVGTTTLAVHLASYLVRQHRSKTLLIDHHHQLGHVCLYLGLKENRYNFNEVAENVDRLDADLMSGFVIPHGSGLSVLASPDVLAVRRRPPIEEIERVFAFLRQEYDFIVIDSSLRYEESDAMTQLSDEIYLVATPDIAAVRDLARHVEHMSLSETISPRLRIVINRVLSDNSIGPDQIEKALRRSIFTTIPNDYAELLGAINGGETISPQRRSEFTNQISRWAGDLAGPPKAQDKPAAAAATRKKLGFWR